jgi:hypothetical protein
MSARTVRAQRVWNESCDAISAMLAFSDEEAAARHPRPRHERALTDDDVRLRASLREYARGFGFGEKVFPREFIENAIDYAARQTLTPKNPGDDGREGVA